MIAPTSASPPKVFFSYSHDSKEHQDRVLELCDRLRAEGIDAEVDQYNPHPPEGWPRWMGRQIKDAEFVLVVCTATYRRRFEGREVGGRGLGSNWEGAIITQAIYEAGGENAKFIPVVFSEGDEAQIPGPLRATTRYRVDTTSGYEELYRRLTNQPAVLKPTLGPIRPLPSRPRMTSFSPASPGRRKNVVVVSVIAIAVVALVGFLFPRNASRPEELVNPRRVQLVPKLDGVTSMTWSPSSQELLMVGARGTKELHLFRYSPEGKVVSEISSPPGGGVQIQSPRSAQTVDGELIVKDEHNFVWLDEDYQPQPPRDLLISSPSGDSLVNVSEWAFIGENLFILGDAAKRKDEVPSADGSTLTDWRRGIFMVPPASPRDFAKIRLLAANDAVACSSGLYMTGYPHLAGVKGLAYFLDMNDDPPEGSRGGDCAADHQETVGLGIEGGASPREQPGLPEIVPLRLGTRDENTAGFPVHLNGFDGKVNLQGIHLPRVYASFDSSALHAGLYAWEDALFVLSKCPTIDALPTRWFLTRFDPETGKQLYTLSLPVSSRHLIIAAGKSDWALAEGDSPEPPPPGFKVSYLTLIPSGQILNSTSPLTIDGSLPLCTRPARWSYNPLGWLFGQAK